MTQESQVPESMPEQFSSEGLSADQPLAEPASVDRQADMFTILRVAVDAGASDVHLAAARKPMMRVNGVIKEVDPDFSMLSAEDSKALVYSILYNEQRLVFEKKMELDCSYAIPGFARFRVNVHMQREGVGAVMRVIQSEIPSAEFLGLPDSIMRLTDLPRGLILVTGPTGCGKSTTLARMIDDINQKRKEHILTIEDPIEYVYEEKSCVITQRELNQTTLSFANALRAALRQDPDVILVGEMRDLETISLALTASETGHLVFATLHTTDASQTVDRIVDVFPHQQQQMVRTQLASVLKAVVSQTLMPRVDKPGRVSAREIMLVDAAIGTMIREGKTPQIYGAIDLGKEAGMVSLERDLERLVREGEITLDQAIAKSNRTDNLLIYLADQFEEEQTDGQQESAGKKKARFTIPGRRK